MRNLHLLPGLLLLTVTAIAQNPEFEERRQQYIAQSLSNFSGNAITLQAYEGVPVNQAELDAVLGFLPQNTTADFQIVKLVRVLFLSDGEYEAQILPVLDGLPFWLTYGDTVRGYWSENHMIMWMSSHWLLHERYGRPADATLEQRLLHYLQLKVDLGFYEFFSSTYMTYCLSGLLNLADFAQDETIRTLAAQASQRLLRELLMLTNDRGVFYPIAGRNYWSKYLSPYGENHNGLIWLLTGLGPMPETASHSGGFLASSALDVDEVIASWSAQLNVMYPIGHTLAEAMAYHSGLSHVDRIMFLWSAGGYFHPLVAEQSAQLLVDSNFWGHVDFAPFEPISFIEPPAFPALAEDLSAMSYSSVITGQEIAIYKDGPVTLSSIQDFWRGKLGYQQFPVVANLGTVAVVPASGPPLANFLARPSNNANEHLPYVAQSGNVALVMYRTEDIPEFLGYQNREVTLLWPADQMDETRESGQWLLGRQGDGYVAVYRHCTGMINGLHGCTETLGQTWAIVVGTAASHGSFDAFEQMAASATVTQQWTYDPVAGEWIYASSITFGPINIAYDWRGPNGPVSAAPIQEARALSIYPNPSSGLARIVCPEGGCGQMTVTDLSGRTVYSKSLAANEINIELDMSFLNAGTYLVHSSGRTPVRWVVAGK